MRSSMVWITKFVATLAVAIVVDGALRKAFARIPKLNVKKA